MHKSSRKCHVVISYEENAEGDKRELVCIMQIWRHLGDPFGPLSKKLADFISCSSTSIQKKKGREEGRERRKKERGRKGGRPSTSKWAEILMEKSC